MNYSSFFKQYFPDNVQKNIIADIKTVLDSGRLINGPFIKQVEQSIADYLGLQNASAVNSCTTALTICLKYFDVKDREVLVPANSFITCVSSIIFAGGQPVLVDINPYTLSFDIEDLRKKITKKTKGIVWPHLLGVISRDYKEIVSICRKNKLFIIEDCAQAHGAEIDGKMAGSLADAACFSFYATKIIAAGSGGLIASDNNDLISYANKMRLFGKDHQSGSLVDFGNDWILDELRSSVIFRHFQDIGRNLAERRSIAAYYLKYLKNTSGISFLDYGENANPAFYQFAVMLDSSIERDNIIKLLKEQYKIEARSFYIPIHKEGIFAHLDTQDLNKSEDAMNRILCLPLHHFMTEEDVIYVSNALKKELSFATF